MLKGEFIDPAASKVLVGELGPEWLSRQTHMKPSAFRPVEIAWRVHVEPVWGGVAVADVRKTAIQSWVSGMTAGAEGKQPKGASTVIRAFGVLAAILDEAVDDRRILTNPARGVNLPRKPKKQHVYLTHEQVHSLPQKRNILP